MLTDLTDLSLSVAGRGEVSALCQKPPGCRHFLVLGHGAGAGMHHAFMDNLAQALAGRGIGTLRYQFPYMDRGQRRPDPAHMLEATVRAAVNSAGLLARELPLFAGGKSMGGRMTSQAQADRAFQGLRGLVFYGFPLHPIGEPGIARAEHLRKIGVPMLFLQGRRDRLALPHLLEPVLEALGSRATVRWLDEADHEFGLPRRAGMDRPAVAAWLAQQTEQWMSAVTGQGPAQ
jgi:predicted alpha/beta-hydrolase family hydrolase